MQGLDLIEGNQFFDWITDALAGKFSTHREEFTLPIMHSLLRAYSRR